MDNIASAALPFWLLGIPLVLAVLDLMRTPRGHVDRNHSSMSRDHMTDRTSERTVDRVVVR